MNELFDKLIIRMIFTLFICLVLFLYKFAHLFLYPSARKQIFKRFYPSKNSADTLHFFARLIGIGLIFSEFYFYMSNGILLALFDFLLLAGAAFFLFLVSIYIIESIVLYNFEYSDEILKRKNSSYAFISFSLAIGFAYILKTVVAVSNNSLVFLFFLWLFSIVIIGFATKSYRFFSNLSFNKLLIQKNMALSVSYAGFIWGWSIIIASSLNHPLKDIRDYIALVILKIILSLIIFPLFRKGLIYIFKLQNDLKPEVSSSSTSSENKHDLTGPEIGYGVYEGAVFFTSCFLTSIITTHVSFGTFYPVF